MKKLISLLAACLCAGVLITLGVSQEVPVGAVKGSVKMAENNRTLAGILVVLSPALKSDDLDFQARNWHVKTDAEGKFSFANIPCGDYRVEVAAKEHNLKSRMIQIQEGGQAPLDLQLSPQSPRLQLYASQKVIAPLAQAKLEVSGFVPTDEFSVSVRKLKLDQIAEKGGIQAALEPVSHQRNAVSEKDLNQISEKVYSGQLDVPRKDAEGAFVQPLSIPALSEGLYFVTVSGEGLNASTYLNVSRVALVTKSVDQTALCYVTDIDSGRPLSNVPLSIPTGTQLKQVGTTDGRGLSTVTLHGSEKAGLIMAQWGKSVAVADAPLNPANATDGDDATNPNTRIFTYADRPIYRPGDTVQFKAIVRRLSGLELKLPPAGQATVKILDNQENLLETKTLPISSHGNIEGQFTTSPEAKPGVYQVQVEAAGGKDSYYANLADYRKPDYSITVTPKSKRYVVGDQAEATVDCQYFFGGPVLGAKVTATIYRSPEWSEYDDEDFNSEDTQDFSGGQFVQDVDAVTDGTGKATIKFPTALDPKEGGAYNDYRYSINASVSSSSGHSFDGSGSVLVTRGSFRLDVTSDPLFLSVNEPGNIVVHTQTFDPTSKPVAGIPVQLTIEEETYTRHTVVYQPIKTLSVTTDATGTVKIPFAASEAKNVRVRALTKDSAGRPVQTETHIWVDGSLSESDSESSTVNVKLDKKKYSVGETAKVLISADRPGGVALLTVESDSIKRKQTVDLAKGSSVVRIPVDRSMSPNAFVSVSYVYKRVYAEASKRIDADRKDKKLVVTVIPDEKKSLPGAKVGFQVKTTDVNGHGVKANVSLGVVDESIYAIKKDTTDIAKDLYPRKDDEIQTNFSFPEIYLDGGDKGGGSVPVRRKFLDTAAWIPEIETDAQGTAHVSLKIPDNLTSWRATAVAATDDTAVGMSTANMVATKPLMVRITAPQFLVATDSQSLGADVTNDSGQSLNVNLAVKSTGLKIGVLDTNSFTLQAGETRTIPLAISTESSGNGVITATVTSDKGFSDAVESKLGILPHARLVETNLSAAIDKKKDFKFVGQEHRDPNAGGLEVTISPSIASGLIQSLDSLVQFPYGCVEQTLSRFLPAIRVVKTIKGTPLEKSSLLSRADKITEDGFARLQKMQHADGGWGWWTYDDSDPFMTAWVLDGLQVAKSCGREAPATLDVEKALHWAANRLQHPLKSDEPDALTYLTLAAAEYGRSPNGAEQFATLDVSGAGIGRTALVALAADKVGAKALSEKMLDAIVTKLKTDDLKPKGKFYWWSQDEDLALALRALVSLRPEEPVIAQTIVRLTQLRKIDGWISTRATTIATLAQCDYLDRHPQSIRPSKLTLTLNGSTLQTINIDPAKPNVPDLRIKLPTSRIYFGTNTFTVEADGGSPYVSVNLRQYEVEPELKQVIDDSSLSVQRAYYKMEATRTDDGAMSLLPSKSPTSRFLSGDIIRCVVTVHCDHPVDFLFIEDPLPSNCRVTDREDPMDGEPWDYWWSDLTIMDDRVALFSREMSAGTHQLTYTLRAEGSGTSTALPTHAQDMYVPDLSASGAENRLEVVQ